MLGRWPKADATVLLQSQADSRFTIHHAPFSSMKATCRTQYLSFSRHTGVLREAVLKPLGVRVSAALALQLSEVKAIAQAG